MTDIDTVSKLFLTSSNGSRVGTAMFVSRLHGGLCVSGVHSTHTDGQLVYSSILYT